MNAFEAGERKVIPAVLLYARHKGPQDERILMIHRVPTGLGGAPAKPDYHAGKWNGLGGKLEADESPLQAARREMREESGVDLPESAFKPIGVLQFPNFKAHKNEDWLCYVFVADLTDEQARSVPSSCAEGQLHWIPSSDIVSLNLWPGDRHFIPHVLAAKPFIGTLWYEGQNVRDVWIRSL